MRTPRTYPISRTWPNKGATPVGATLNSSDLAVYGAGVENSPRSTLALVDRC